MQDARVDASITLARWQVVARRDFSSLRRALPQDLLDMSTGSVEGTGRAAVICAYNPHLDREWLDLFLTSLRATGYAGDVHCVGSFDHRERDRIAELRCQEHPLFDRPPGIDWENAAHIHMSRVLDRIAADPHTRPKRVLLLSTMRAGFVRAPCGSATDGVSLFAEGRATIGELAHNVGWLREFVPSTDPFLGELIVSSSLVEGSPSAARWFYKLLFSEFVDRVGLLLVPKVI